MSEYLRRLFRRHPRRSPVEIVDILLNRCYPSPFAGAGRRQHERAGGREREREKEENKKEIRKRIDTIGHGSHAPSSAASCF